MISKQDQVLIALAERGPSTGADLVDVSHCAGSSLSKLAKYGYTEAVGRKGTHRLYITTAQGAARAQALTEFEAKRHKSAPEIDWSWPESARPTTTDPVVLIAVPADLVDALRAVLAKVTAILDGIEVSR